MKRILCDFDKCDLALLEELYHTISEKQKKRFLGEAIYNWLIWANTKGAFKDKQEFNNTISTFFPPADRVEHYARVFTQNETNRLASISKLKAKIEKFFMGFKGGASA